MNLPPSGAVSSSVDQRQASCGGCRARAGGGRENKTIPKSKVPPCDSVKWTRLQRAA